MKINCGVIGLGVGEKHLKTLLSLKNINISFICDFNKKKLNYIKNKYKNYKNLQKCDFVNDYKQTLNNDTHLVIIASFDNFHAEQIINFAKRKTNIFIEKPLCQNNSEFLKIKKIIKKHKIYIGSNFVLRENPIFKKLKKKILENKMGKIYHLESEYNYGRLKKLHKGWRGKIDFYSVNQGGAIHMLDLIMYLLNTYKAKEVYSVSNNIASKNSNFKYHDVTSNLIKFYNGVTCKVTANFSSVTPHHHKFSLFGTKGSFEYNYLNNIYYFSNDYQKERIYIKKNPIKFDKSLVLKNFIKLIRSKNSKSLLLEKNNLFDLTKIILHMDKNILKKK